METGYEIEPERIGRTADRRRPAAAIVVALIVVAVVLVKPWVGPGSSSQAAGPTSPAAIAAASPAGPVLVARPVAVAVAPVADPIWPAGEVPTALATETARQAETELASLAIHAGAWGIGDAGVGPRMLRDEPWSDWAAADPETVTGGPIHIATWPGTDLCARYPTIYDLPTLVAVTTPRDVAPDQVLDGWWTDGGRVASLAGSIVSVAGTRNPGVSFLERVDQAPWPPGLYEFHVVGGGGSVALTVCLTRRG